MSADEFKGKKGLVRLLNLETAVDRLYSHEKPHEHGLLSLRQASPDG